MLTGETATPGICLTCREVTVGAAGGGGPGAREEEGGGGVADHCVEIKVGVRGGWQRSLSVGSHACSQTRRAEPGSWKYFNIINIPQFLEGNHWVERKNNWSWAASNDPEIIICSFHVLTFMKYFPYLKLELSCQTLENMKHCSDHTGPAPVCSRLFPTPSCIFLSYKNVLMAFLVQVWEQV